MTDEVRARPGSSRRQVFLLAGAGAVAAVGGIGAAWWNRQPSASSSDASALWSLTFATPNGGELAMGVLKGRRVLLNFWATWCPPCVEELPLLDRFQQQHAGNGWQVVGLAIDQPSAVRQFLSRTPVRFPIGLAGLEGTQLAKDLGNLAGGLPFSVALGRDGGIVQRRMGKLSQADLDAWAAAG